MSQDRTIIRASRHGARTARVEHGKHGGARPRRAAPMTADEIRLALQLAQADRTEQAINAYSLNKGVTE